MLSLTLEVPLPFDFNKKASDEKREMSFDDKSFLKIANESISLLDGHYTLNLLFRKDDVIMPNNRHMAMQRLLSLKRKLREVIHSTKSTHPFSVT